MTSYVHTINTRLATIIGEPESILLNQLEYWISKCGRDIDNLDGKWIYNSYKKWSEQFTYWSTSKLRRTIKSLENLGLIKSTKVNSKKWNQTKWYSIDYHEYNKLLEGKHLNLPSSKTSAIIYKDATRSNSNSSKVIVSTELKNKDLLTTFKMQKTHQVNKSVKFTEVTPTINKDSQKSPEVCICSKWTNRSVQNEQMLIVTKNNYTKNNSSKNKNFVNFAKEEGFSINSKKEVDIVNQMLDKWNNIFEYSLRPIKAYSNEKIIARLNKAYKDIFNSSMDNWEEYAIKVNSSKFLMGEKETKKDFKATFAWLSKLDTIQMILSGEYGVGDRGLDMNNIKINVESIKEEIVNKVDKKISEYIKINDKKEREEFKEYVRNTSITEEDSYGILKHIIKQVPKNYILEREEYKGIRENLFESYVMKKYLGSTKLEIRKKMRERIMEIDEIADSKKKIQVLREIERKIEIRERMMYHPLDKKMLNHNSGLLESILSSKQKKESRNLKGSSEEISMIDLVI
eukprot:GHVR01029421.1.p1 GENE.GHVR01029421.1~~GHVR01029421.1.p1  ORF type:complete len:515 (+),score=61.54 GHVR01029421.1:2024-3568(+)